MKKIQVLLSMICIVLLSIILTGCSSSGYSGNTSVRYSYGNSWDYDRYYRSRVNHHYRRSEVRRSAGAAEVRTRARASRAGRR